MTWKRAGGVGCLFVALVMLPALAQEPPVAEEPPEEPEKLSPAPAEEQPKKKAGWWGSGFSLYVEATLGNSSFDDLDSSIQTVSNTFSTNRFTLDDNAYGNVTVGWKFPFERGKVLVSWTGYKEDSYAFAASARRNSVYSYTKEDRILIPYVLPYWDLTVSGGQLVAVRTNWVCGETSPCDAFNIPPPNEAQSGKWIDSNGDQKITMDEFTLGEPGLVVSRRAPENLQNRLQTLDLLIQRDFGGRRVSGQWTGGLRRFQYEGYVPAAAWIAVNTIDGLGWTDGLLHPLIAFSQNTVGVGPSGSLAVRAHFFRKRLTIYGKGRTAFLLQSLETDSGPFTTMVPDPIKTTIIHAAPARLQQSLNKSVWHVGGEVGVDLVLMTGLHLTVAYERMGYLDAVLLPHSISIPDRIERVPQGTVALYNTQDLIADGWRFGFGYQF